MVEKSYRRHLGSVREVVWIMILSHRGPITVLYTAHMPPKGFPKGFTYGKLSGSLWEDCVLLVYYPCRRLTSCCKHGIAI